MEGTGFEGDREQGWKPSVGGAVKVVCGRQSRAGYLQNVQGPRIGGSLTESPSSGGYGP